MSNHVNLAIYLQRQTAQRSAKDFITLNNKSILMGFLAPIAKSGKSNVPAVIINGKVLRFSKVTAEALNLDDHLNIYLGEKEDGEENRLYFLTNQSGQAKWKLNGKKGRVRAISDANVVTIARLGSDTYPLVESKTGKTKGWYLEFNPENPVPTFQKKKRNPSEPRNQKATEKGLREAPDKMKAGAMAGKK